MDQCTTRRFSETTESQYRLSASIDTVPSVSKDEQRSTMVVEVEETNHLPIKVLIFSTARIRRELTERILYSMARGNRADTLHCKESGDVRLHPGTSSKGLRLGVASDRY